MNRVAAAIESGVRAGLHSGAQVYVARRGETVVDQAFGEARPFRPLQTNDLLLWMSSVKPVAALALARLQEEGRLNFDDLVRRFLPEFAGPGKEVVAIRHLLTHTAGLRPLDRVEAGPLDWESLIASLCATPMEEGWPTGEKAGYHLSGSWYLLAEIVQRIVQRPFSMFVRDAVFWPSGMRDSWIGMPEQTARAYLNDDRVQPMRVTFRNQNEPYPDSDTLDGCLQCKPGGGGRGPIRELGFLYENLLNCLEQKRQDGWLQPKTVAWLTRRHREGLYDHTFRHTMDWGMGFMVNSRRYGPDTVPYNYGDHASEAAFGHGGAQSSCAFADPEHRLAVAWICNGMPGEPKHQRRARAINNAIYEDLGLA